MSLDKVTVGLTPLGEQRLERVMNSRYMSEELTAYRIAIAVALARGEITPREEMKKVKTKFNVGSLDRDGRLREMIEITMPQDASGKVFEVAERLADAGIAILDECVQDGRPLSDLLLEEIGTDELPNDN